MATAPVLTITGNLTSNPELRFTPQQGAPVATFTVAYTPRTFNRQAGEWQDGTTLYLRCVAWREMAENIAESLTKGSRVVVVGELVQRNYTDKEGNNRSVVELSVEEIGTSLRFGTTTYTRTSRGAGSATRNQAANSEPAASATGEGDTYTEGDANPWMSGETNPWGPVAAPGQ